MNTEKNIYELGLFESTFVKLEGTDVNVSWRIVRVPGGWIFQDGHSSTFVPHWEEAQLFSGRSIVPQKTQEEVQKERLCEFALEVYNRLVAYEQELEKEAPGRTLTNKAILRRIQSLLHP